MRAFKQQPNNFQMVWSTPFLLDLLFKATNAKFYFFPLAICLIKTNTIEAFLSWNNKTSEAMHICRKTVLVEKGQSDPYDDF